MLLSRTSQYAIQSLIFLATYEPGKPVLSRHVAERLGVPVAYLAKIMQDLVRGGLLSSTRGRYGGFFLRENPSEVNLTRILELTEGVRFTDECVLGLKTCSDETACPLHRRWMPIKERVLDMLRQETLEDLAQAVKSGLYRIADFPKTLFKEKET